MCFTIQWKDQVQNIVQFSTNEALVVSNALHVDLVFVARLYDFQPKLYVSSWSVLLSMQYKLKRHLKYSHVWIEMYKVLFHSGSKLKFII